jgi:hypothetical protein
MHLENITEEFPYFQAAHFLFLNGLKKQNSFKYNNTLKKVAAYTADREVLFDFITSYDFNFPNILKDIPEEKIIKSNEIIEEQNLENIEIQVPEMSLDLSSEETLSPGKPFRFDVSETHSFNEWLQITSIKPIERTLKGEIGGKTTKSPVESSSSNFDLIEKFIAANPKIKPSKTFIHSDIATESIIENENLMTETLAHVYLEQKKYQKAITAFTILSLKYPEKSSFFANQIEAIKKLEEK